jgi:alpha-tubulin suppressor-like RCC1 family protein
MQDVAAGLWHTVCISADGGVYSFGGNQFGQLGIGSDQAEVGILILFFILITPVNLFRASDYVVSLT